MLKKLSRYLFLANSGVFLLVLVVFSIVVYFSVVHNLFEEEKSDLLTLTNAVVDSFGAADSKGKTESIPEILTSNQEDSLLEGASLQWFDATGKLVTRKGALSISAPFTASATFQEQAQPHVLLLTRAVQRSGILRGYLRSAIALNEVDTYSRQLLVGLTFGMVLALLAASIGALWLTRQSLKPIEQTLDKLRQFSSDAAHELKNPLMAVKTNAAVALRHEEEIRPKDKEKFEAILDAADQMIKTTADLLKLAQSEQYSMTEDAIRLDVSAVLAQVCSDLAPLAVSKSIGVKTDLPSELFVRAREEDLKSLFGNVIENAVQYSRTNGNVTIRANKHGKNVLIEVADTGIGMKTEELPKLFERFWRSEHAREHRLGGNGLGLAIVRAILDRYGGDVIVTSQLGVGTKVTINLPAASDPSR